MKKSRILVNLLRGLMVVLAYKNVVHPKGGLIPPGTGRHSFQYLKSSFHIARGMLLTSITKLRLKIGA